MDQLKQNILDQVMHFPSSPGVYLMKDKDLKIIYVGKAKNLRARVRQYFGQNDTRYQVQFLMERVSQIDFLVTTNEKEALLLENSLIKKHKPRYNVFLKDDKTYQGLKITITHKYPQLLTSRKIKKDGAHYFGPFTSSDSLYKVKEFIDQHFQLRTCSDFEFSQRTRPCLEYQIKRCSAPCVGYVDAEQYKNQIQDVEFFLNGRSKHLQKLIEQRMILAAGEERFEDAARHRDLLQSMSQILEGQQVAQLAFDFIDVIALTRDATRIGVAVLMVRDNQLIDSKYRVFESMESNEEFLENFIIQYYNAESYIPKQIVANTELHDVSVVKAVLAERAGRTVDVSLAKRGDKMKLMELALENLKTHFHQRELKQKRRIDALEALQKQLGLSRLPDSIECYDISNISGQHAVASMVTFVNGEKFSEGYRKFKIRTVEGPNDFAMLHETLSRRLKRHEGLWRWPDLIVVDGGKGQLNKVLQVLEELNITGIDVISIAKGKGEGARAKGAWQNKKEEEIYLPQRKNPVLLRRGSAELLLLQEIRDESHRFAIQFHRQLRDAAMTSSSLDDIKGLGKKIKQDLLKKFGSLDGLLEASDDELLLVSGVTKSIISQLRTLTKLTS